MRQQSEQRYANGRLRYYQRQHRYIIWLSGYFELNAKNKLEAMQKATNKLDRLPLEEYAIDEIETVR